LQLRLLQQGVALRRQRAATLQKNKKLEKAWKKYARHDYTTDQLLDKRVKIYFREYSETVSSLASDNTLRQLFTDDQPVYRDNDQQNDSESDGTLSDDEDLPSSSSSEDEAEEEQDADNLYDAELD